METGFHIIDRYGGFFSGSILRTVKDGIDQYELLIFSNMVDENIGRAGYDPFIAP